jgi:hypothetical protein
MQRLTNVPALDTIIVGGGLAGLTAALVLWLFARKKIEEWASDASFVISFRWKKRQPPTKPSGQGGRLHYGHCNASSGGHRMETFGKTIAIGKSLSADSRTKAKKKCRRVKATAAIQSGNYRKPRVFRL